VWRVGLMKTITLAAAICLALWDASIAQVSCQNSGNFTYCSNGRTFQRNGNFTYDNQGLS